MATGKASPGGRAIGKRTSVWPILIVVLLFTLAAVGYGGGAEELTAPGLSLPLADGWSYQEQEEETTLLMASRAGDLETTSPEGPRIWIHWAGIDDEFPAGLVEKLLFAGLEGTPAQVLGPPLRIQVDNLSAPAIDLQTGEIQQRYVVVNPGAEHVYTFILEAPAGEWETALAEMERILETVSFR